MAEKLSEVPERADVYFDEDNPLGPAAAEYIKDEQVAAYLVSLENEAFREIAQGAHILYGRKGAGKSSLLNSFLYPSRLKTSTRLSLENPATTQKSLPQSSDFFRNYDLIVPVDAAKEFSAVYGDVLKDNLPGTELAARHWEARLWLNAMFTGCRRTDLVSKLSHDLREDLIKVAASISSALEYDSALDYLDSILLKSESYLLDYDMLAVRLRSEFIDRGLSIVFLIDSIENYNFLENANLKITVSGLLYLVSSSNKNIRYKVAFPYEAVAEIKQQGNPEKLALASATINWKSIELIKIVSKRLLLGIYLHNPNLFDETIRVSTVNGYGRIAYFKLWESVFGGDYVNEAHQEEPAFFYVLRHTQLLPRQLILALNKLMSLSRVGRTNYAFISLDVMADATKISCGALIAGVEAGFQHTYPKLNDAFDRFLPSCDIVTSYDELHRVYNTTSSKGSEEYRSDFYYFMRFLLHVGAFGIVQPGLETERYVVASFVYDDETILRKFEGKTFAMHPAFSMFYKDEYHRQQVGKAILPRATIEGLS